MLHCFMQQITIYYSNSNGANFEYIYSLYIYIYIFIEFLYYSINCISYLNYLIYTQSILMYNIYILTIQHQMSNLTNPYILNINQKRNENSVILIKKVGHIFSVVYIIVCIVFLLYALLQILESYNNNYNHFVCCSLCLAGNIDIFRKWSWIPCTDNTLAASGRLGCS